MPEKLFFRALYTPEHLIDWRSGNFNSYHYALPGLWLAGYYKYECRRKDCLPLRFKDGIKEVEYTENARAQFLKHASEYRLGEIWLPEQRKSSSELNGICAFDNAKDAYEFGSTSAAGRQGFECYIVFKGMEICPAPEDNGYVARVIEVVEDVIASDKFRTLFLSNLD